MKKLGWVGMKGGHWRKVHQIRPRTLRLTAAPGCVRPRRRFFSCFLLVSLCRPCGSGRRGQYYAVPSFQLVLLLYDVFFRNDCHDQRVKQLRNAYETFSMPTP